LVDRVEHVHFNGFTMSTIASPSPIDPIAPIVDRTRQIEQNARIRNVAHDSAANWWDNIYMWLGTASAILALLAGVISTSSGSSSTAASGSIQPATMRSASGGEVGTAPGNVWAALVAGALAIVNTAINPKERSQRHQISASAFGRLAERLMNFHQVHCTSGTAIVQLMPTV
jgi:hypothetical protein